MEENATGLYFESLRMRWKKETNCLANAKTTKENQIIAAVVMPRIINTWAEINKNPLGYPDCVLWW